MVVEADDSNEDVPMNAELLHLRCLSIFEPYVKSCMMTCHESAGRY